MMRNRKEAGRVKKITFGKAVKKYHNYYLMLIPGIIFIIMFLYLPIFFNFIAFKDYKIFMGPFGSPWCGLENFEQLFRSLFLEDIGRISNSDHSCSSFK